MLLGNLDFGNQRHYGCLTTSQGERLDMAKKRTRQKVGVILQTSELEQQHQEIMQFNIPTYPSPPDWRESAWSSIVPRVVPSVATYGAYEKPI